LLFCQFKYRSGQLSGLELKQKLAERGIIIPVIFLTAFDSNEIRQHARQAGAAGYLRKPVDDQALLDTIHWAIIAYSI
jgi:FixJ family two-component response regulator